MIVRHLSVSVRLAREVIRPGGFMLAASDRVLISTMLVDPGGMLLVDAESGRLEGARSGFYMLRP